jgi:hypothetical protein
VSDKYNSCDKETILSQLLKVQAQVKVIPLVKHGKPIVRCIKTGIKPHSSCCDYGFDVCDDYDEYGLDCDYESDCYCCRNPGCGFACEPEDTCDFTLTQLICVEIPISFDADVNIKKGVLCCGKPDIVPDFKPCFNNIEKGNQIYILMKRQF